MAIPHSRSVHLLIDLLVADRVMKLSSSDYHEQTGCLFVLPASVLCGIKSFITGRAEVDKYMCTYMQAHALKSANTLTQVHKTSLSEFFEQKEKIEGPEAKN